MMPFKLNLSKMKKIGGDDKSSIFQHPDGHKITIAHQPLSSIQKKQIEKMPVETAAATELEGQEKAPSVKEQENLYGNTMSDSKQFAKGGKVQKYADGGPTPNPMPNTSPNPDVPVPTSNASLTGTTGLSPAPLANGDRPNQQKFGQPTQGAAINTQSAAQDDPFGLQKNFNSQISGMNTESAGQQALAKAQGAQGAGMIGPESSYQQNAADALQKYQDNMQQLQNNDLEFQKEVQQGKIDPKHFINNMSTGDKILTGIGVALGGLGSAANGGHNMAYDYFNKEIDRDIDAQKTNLNQQNNLLNHNIQLMGTVKDGAVLTQMQLGDIVNSHLRQEADKAATPIAQANAQIISGQWQQKKAELQRQLSMSQALMQSGQQPEQGFSNRDMYLRMNGQDKLADQLQQTHIPGEQGRTSVPATPENRQALVHFNNLDSLYQRAQEYLQNTNALGTGWQNAHKAEGASIMKAIQLEQGQLVGLQRMTHEENTAFQARTPDLTGTHFTNQDQATLSDLRTELAEKRNNELQGLGLRGHQMPQASSQQVGPGEILRKTKDGRTAVFDQNKKFLRYE